MIRCVIADDERLMREQLRARLGELPRDREIHVICRSAQRAYYATRILLQNGLKARNISGGTLARAMLSGMPAN